MNYNFKKRLPNRAFAYGSVALFHFSLICIVFHKHIFQPMTTIFNYWGDGLKNNFTLLSYVKEPIGKEGLFKYNKFSYPFGDYVYSTDNTPLFSIPFKWFCWHIYDLSDYTLPLFNFFILSNIIACGLLAFFIFKRLWGNNLLAWLMAMILPWTNFQMARIYSSHYNLSFTSFSLIAIALFMWWQASKGHIRKQVLIGIIMSLFGFCCFLAHGYYVIIIPVFTGGMLFFSGLLKIRSGAGRVSVLASFAVTGLTACLVFLMMRTTDGYFAIRQEYAMGYDWMEQKTNFSLLFTHYSFQRFFFPIWIEKYSDSIELMSYLGNVGLYTMALFFIISVFHRPFRLLLLDIQKGFFRDPLTFGIFFSGLLMLSMSFGENYYPLMERLRVTLPFTREPGFSPAELICITILLGIILYAAVRMIIASKGRNLYPLPKENTKSKVLKITGFYVLSTALLYMMFGHYTVGPITNFSNPVYHLHKITRMVEQFRSIVRLAWPFYWTFYIWIIYTLAKVYLRVNRHAKLFIIAMIVLLGGEETIDFCVKSRAITNQHSPFAKEDMQRFRQLKMPMDHYQAILPIPYYNVGSEVYPITFNDIDDWSSYSYQLSLYGNLPLMSCKLSRTPPAFSQDFLTLISQDTCSPELKSRLNDKPILVAVNRKYVNDSTQTFAIPDIKQYPVSHDAYWKANQLVERNKLQPVDSMGDVYFYRWSPQRR